jgi:hypothetical protein
LKIEKAARARGAEQRLSIFNFQFSIPNREAA